MKKSFLKWRLKSRYLNFKMCFACKVNPNSVCFFAPAAPSAGSARGASRGPTRGASRGPPSAGGRFVIGVARLTVLCSRRNSACWLAGFTSKLLRISGEAQPSHSPTNLAPRRTDHLSVSCLMFKTYLYIIRKLFLFSVSVLLHMKPLFLPIDIQHIQCPC